VIISLLIGTQLTYLLGQSSESSTTTSINNLKTSLDFYPLLVQVSLNTSIITHLNETILVNESITNVGKEPANAPSGYSEDLEILSPNGTEIASSYVLGDENTPARVELNQSQVISDLYYLTFTPKQGEVGFPADSWNQFGAHICGGISNPTRGVYTLIFTIVPYPSDVSNQTDNIVIPLQIYP
jgi:hypothetical protein